MNILGSPYLLAGAAIIAFGGGWQVHGWKVASDTEKAIEQVLEQSKEELKQQKKLTEGEIERSNRLSGDLRDTRIALNDAINANSILASSRAATSTRIIEKGENIGNALQNNYPCIREPWPVELLDYANGADGGSGLLSAPQSLAGG